MIVNLKFLNGDLFSIEMETYSEQAVREFVRTTIASNVSNVIQLIENDDEKNEDKNEKNICVMIQPVHKYGKEFLAIIKQTVDDSYEKGDTMDGSLSKRWLKECHACATENGYVSFIEKKEDLVYYFDQVMLFVDETNENIENVIRGDSYVNEKETALEAVTRLMLEGHPVYYLDDPRPVPVYKYVYKQLCKMSSSDVLNRIVSQLCNDFQLDFDDIEDVVSENRFSIRGQFLSIIDSIHCSSIDVFHDVEEVSFDDFISLDIQNINHHHIMGLLKFYMNDKNDDIDDDFE